MTESWLEFRLLYKRAHTPLESTTNSRACCHQKTLDLCQIWKSLFRYALFFTIFRRQDWEEWSFYDTNLKLGIEFVCYNIQIVMQLELEW